METVCQHISRTLLTAAMLVVGSLYALAQEPDSTQTATLLDSHDAILQAVGTDNNAIFSTDTSDIGNLLSKKQQRKLARMEQKGRQQRDWSTWHPDPKRAMWLALVIPGAGQIYNHKYWKLPIVYGGFVGCAYAMRWNNMMYRDYSQAYMDLMDNDPETRSYDQFMHLGAQINSTNQSRYEKLFKSRKDRFRRWRDMSFFVLVGVYAISVVDAYVDASLSEFDISDDLSLRVEPILLNNPVERDPIKSNALGLQCSFTF